MNKNSSQTTNKYDNISGSNPSLITAGFPSGSIMTARLIQPSSAIKQNHHLNQNRAIDTQRITLPSEKNDHSQYTILSHRTISDTYLNISRQDIDDVMTALHTLAQYVQNDIDNKNPRDIIPNDDNESHPLTMLYSTSSTQANSSSHHYHPRYSIGNRRHSLSSDHCLNHHHHHVIKRMYLYPVEEFQHDLYDMKHKQERRILRQLQYYQKYFNHHNSLSYPSYSSNAILYTSTCRPRQTYHCSWQHQSTIKIPSEDQYQQSIKTKLSSSIPLSFHILDKFVYIDEKQPISSIQMLPQQAHTLQILQNNHIHSFMSIDSLNTKNILCTTLKPCCLQKLNHNQIFGIRDQLNLNKIDVSTQWSLQTLTPKCIEMDVSRSNSSLKCQDDQENATILTELSQSITTIATNNSIVRIPLKSQTQSVMNNSLLINDACNIKLDNDTNEKYLEKTSVNVNDEYDLTKSETERFLTTFNIPTCKCSTKKLQTINTNVEHSSVDDSITCISFDNDSSICSSLHKKKTKPISIKLASKRPRHHTSKSSKNNQIIKRSRLHHRSQSNNRLMSTIQSHKTIDSQEDSSFDFFDIDTTFSDTYDRLFTYTTASEKSS